MRKLIGLTGLAGAGKSTVANYLIEEYGFTLVKMAGPIKAMMKALGLSERDYNGDLKETPHPLLCGKTPRHAMQTLGTEWGRDLIGPDFWVNAAMARADAILDDDRLVVIDDVRFPNEVAAVRARNGLILKVWRPGVGGTSTHASETHVLESDGTLVNDGTVEELHAKVKLALEHKR